MQFIHFGCWNNGLCTTNGSNDLSRVMSALRKEKPDFITICGDNYYPEKKKGEKKDKNDKTGKKEKGSEEKDKIKVYNPSDLEAGFACLPNNVPIHVVFGNHDYETELILHGVKENTCTLIRDEIEISAKHNNLNLHFFHVFSPHPSTLIIMLDTTIYDKKADDYLQCYAELDKEYTTVAKVKDAQRQLLKRALSSYSPEQFQNIVIIGHHPIIHYKWKDETLKEIRLSTEFEHLLYNEIYATFGENATYTYLCADLHQYQCGDVVLQTTMRIRQHIVGTGGAKKDEYYGMREALQPVNKPGLQYTMSMADRRVSGMKNGYVKCILGENGGLRWVFREVASTKSFPKSKSVTKRRTQSLSPLKRKTNTRKHTTSI